MYIWIFWVTTAPNVDGGNKASEESIASIFRVKLNVQTAFSSVILLPVYPSARGRSMDDQPPNQLTPHTSQQSNAIPESQRS